MISLIKYVCVLVLELDKENVFLIISLYVFPLVSSFSIMLTGMSCLGTRSLVGHTYIPTLYVNILSENGLMGLME